MEVTRIKVRRQRRRGVYRLPISSSATCKWLSAVKNDSDTRHLPESHRRRRCRCGLKEWMVDTRAYEENEAPASFSRSHRACTKCQEDFGDSLEGSAESSDIEPSSETTDESDVCGQVQISASENDIESQGQCAALESGDTELVKCSHLLEDHDNKNSSSTVNSTWRRVVKNDKRLRARRRRQKVSSPHHTSLKERMFEDGALGDKDDAPDNSNPNTNACAMVIHIFKEDVEHTGSCINKSLENSPVELSDGASMFGQVHTASGNESEVSLQNEILERPFMEQSNGTHFVGDFGVINDDVSLHVKKGGALYLGGLNVNGTEILMNSHNSIIVDAEQEQKCFSSESTEQYISKTEELTRDDKAYTLAFTQLCKGSQELSDELLDFITEAELRTEQNPYSEIGTELPEGFSTDFVEGTEESAESIDDHKNILIQLVKEIKVSNSPELTEENCERLPILEAQENKTVLDNQSDTGFVSQLFPEYNDLQSSYQEGVAQGSQCILKAKESQTVVDIQQDSKFVKQLFPEDNDLQSGYHGSIVKESQCALEAQEIQSVVDSQLDSSFERKPFPEEHDLKSRHKDCATEESQCILEEQESPIVVDNQPDSGFGRQTFLEENHLLSGYEECVVEESQCLENFILLDEDEMEVMLTLPVGGDGQPAASVGSVAAPDVGSQGDGPTPTESSASIDLGDSSTLLSEAELKLASDVIQEALDNMATTPAGDAGPLLHFDNVQAALDAIESGGGDGSQAVKTTPTVPVKTESGVQSEVERAARALFSKRTSTLYQWMYPGTPKKKLKASVTRSWDTLPDSEKLFYMSQVMGRFGTPAGSLMVNPQLAGLSTEQMETERAVASLLAAETPKTDEWDPVGVTLRSATRKRGTLSTRGAVREKKSRGARRKLTDLVAYQQESCEDEITPAELFAPLGI